ncbi:MAG: hypothetical protein R3C26_16520 [Calditrichia bacterium]
MKKLADHPFLRKLGTDVLDPQTTIDDVLARYRDARFRGKKVTTLLLDQGFWQDWAIICERKLCTSVFIRRNVQRTATKNAGKTGWKLAGTGTTLVSGRRHYQRCGTGLRN